MLESSRSYHDTQLLNNSYLTRFIICVLHVCCICTDYPPFSVFDPGPCIRPSALVSYQVFLVLTQLVHFNLCVPHFDLHNFFLFKPYFSFVFGPVVFALQWLPNFNHLGTSALETFGPYLPFLTFTACLEMI